MNPTPVASISSSATTYYLRRKYLDAGSVQHFAFPLWAALLGDWDVKGGGLFIAVVEDNVVEDGQDQTNREYEDQYLEPWYISRKVVEVSHGMERVYFQGLHTRHSALY